LAESRSIIFDLDDTLYPYRAFTRSGFRAVARRLAEERRLPVTSVLRVLRNASRTGERGRELHTLCIRFGLPPSMVPWLVAVMRDHVPSLRLPRESLHVLTALRPAWNIAILTNGAPDIQRRKIAALGLRDLVDEVLFAVECGDGDRKPAAAFQVALNRLGTTPETSIYVGDDPYADIAGAAAVGMKTIHLIKHYSMERDCQGAGCGIHLERLELVPATANMLVPMRTRYNVA
jgi:putative hydrolase of the HAD superfamily